MTRSILTIFIVCGLVFTTQAAWSADEEMIVTVRKSEENLQDVPIAITALPSVTLERASVQQLSDVANLTAGLSFQDFNVGALATPVIRGLAQTNTQGRENNVGMFIDGIYLPARNNLDIELLDLERVEVVKGPQSAIYGRSTFAGTINYVTKRPSEELELTVAGSVGTDDYYDGKINLSGPLTDVISGTVALVHRQFDGTINNTDSKDNLGGYEATSGMAKLQFDLTDDLVITATGFYTDKDTESAGVFNEGLNCGMSPPSVFPPDPGGDPTYTCGTLPFMEDLSEDPRARGSQADTLLLTLDIVYDFGDVTLTSITGYTNSEWDAVTDYDADAAGVPYLTVNPPGATNLSTFFFNDTKDDTLSQELRLDGGNDTFEWLAGLYWTTESSESNSAVSIESVNLQPGQTLLQFLPFFNPNLYTTPTPLMPNFYPTQSTADVDIYAAFARLQWNITDRQRVSFEGRYTYEDKEINGISSFTGPPTGIASDDWTYFAPRITYDIDLTDNILLYGSAAQGVKSGGFNPSFGAGFPEEQTYDEETNWTYELGSKGVLADGNVRYDVAIFYVDWDDMQISGESQNNQFFGSIVTNAGSATSKGVEIQIDATIAEWLDAGGGYAYADPKFDSGVTDSSVDTLCGVDLCTLVEDPTDPTETIPMVGGQQVGRTVKNQLNLYADLHSQLVGDWGWYFRTDYIYRDKSPTRSANQQFIDDWNIVNARFGVANEHWDIAVWAKNVFDEEYVTSQIRQPQLNNFVSPTTVIQGSLRQVALTVTYRL